MKSYRHKGARSALLAGVAATALLLAGCTGGGSGGDSSATPAKDQSLTVGISTQPANFTAHNDKGQAGHTLNSLIHRGLLKYDSDGKVVPALAESVEQVNPATYTVKLRPNLTFSDGSPITAENVKNSLLHMGQKDVGSRIYLAASDIDTIDVVDDLTATIHLRDNFDTFTNYLAHPDAYIAEDAELVKGAEALVGAGPYKVASIDEGKAIHLVKSDTFYDASKVQLTKIDLVYYTDATARVNALRSGDVQLIDYIPYEDFPTISSDSSLVLDSVDGPYMNVQFNVTTGPFANPLVRQAVAYAINRETVIDGALGGNGTALSGYPLTGAYADIPGAKMFTYDPDKARELLKQAGYPDGFEASLLTSSTFPFYQDTATAILPDLEAVGIKAKLNSVDWPTYVQSKGTTGQFDLVVFNLAGVVTDPSYIAGNLSGAQLLHSFGYSNDELNSALLAGRAGADEKARTAGYEQAFKLLATDVPEVPLAQRGNAWAYSSHLKGFKNLDGFPTMFSGYTLENAYLVG